MNKISCDICKDLIPIVQDGIASNDSAETVKKHIESCEACAELFEGVKISDSNLNRFFLRFRRKLRIYLILTMLSGICFGVACGIKDGGGVYIIANVILMPVIGILSFFVFRWKALVYVPPLIFAVFLLINAFVSDVNAYSFDMVALLSLVFSAAAVAGILIAGLLKFAFGKDDKDE
ncbi:MAG: zf-HC2 domain-containing protein [Clostridia bacterium]|nr:zf-HC2 domain-containing protein [Clostridia bacterium]